METTTAHKGRLGSPGAQVLMACVVVGVLMTAFRGLFHALLSMFISDSIAREILGLVAAGVFGAQLSMLAIWLCLMTTSLYWILVALGLFLACLFQLVPSPPRQLPLDFLAVGALMATLPLAAMHLAGVRIVQSVDNVAKAYAEPTRFTLRQLFWWTTLAAAVLGLFHAVTVAPRLQFVVSSLAVSGVAIATLWAVLRPGPVWLRMLCLPTTALLIAALGIQQLFGLNGAVVPRLLFSGVVYIMALAGLLAIYRHEGMRLVHRTAGGWLVR